MPGHYQGPPPPPPPKPRPPKSPFDEQRTPDAAGKGTGKKKKGNKLVRGVKNWLNEEKAAAREDYKTLRKLKKNPKY